MQLSKEDHVLSITDAQKMVDEWIEKYGVRYFSPLTNTALLMEEVGELARIMGRLHGEQSFKKDDKPSSLAEELADILWVLLCLANQHNLSLTEAFLCNLSKKTRRDKDRHVNNPKLRAPTNPKEGKGNGN